MAVDTPKRLPEASCLTCWRPENACICSKIAQVPSKTHILVLQHPREVRRPDGTARLISLALPNTTHRVGLSWGSLNQALRRPANPSKWAVLYVGTRKDQLDHTAPGIPYRVFSPTGSEVKKVKLEGIVLLDGNWKQAKSMWWKNRWLSRMNRLVLNPTQLSEFRKVRRSARTEYLSTAEAAAYCLKFLEPNDRPATHIHQLFTSCCLPASPAVSL